MQRTSFSDMACSLARGVDVAGEWWTPLILRDVWMGRTRFDEIQKNLGVSRKLLTDRLDTLVREDVLARVQYQDRPARWEYQLTVKGEELMVVMLALLSWGDRWQSAHTGAPLHLFHEGCRKPIRAEVTCSSCGEPLTVDSVSYEPGPGFRVGRGTRSLPARHPLYADRSRAARWAKAAAEGRAKPRTR